MENNPVYIILTSVTALVAVMVSFYTAGISRRGVIASAISTNRIEWIKCVRALLHEFLVEYSGGCNKKKLTDIYSHMLLYFNPNGKSYAEVVKSLKKCINDGYSDDDYWDLVLKAQLVLSGPWLRMKRESGISSKSEPKLVTGILEEERKALETARSNPKWWADLRK